MQTECTQPVLSFQDLGRRRVEAAFDAGRVSTDCGWLLLREAATGICLFPLLRECFTDHRDAARVEHPLEDLLAQRIFGIASGYEDLNDHNTLRTDPVLALAVGKSDIFGEDRARQQDRGAALASHSTLCRIENAPSKLDPKRRDLKILYDPEAIEDLFVDLALDLEGEAPDRIVLDVDASHFPLHGRQEERFFHGYYDCFCYLPLFVFWGDHLLVAKLRPANIGEARDALDELRRVVGHIRTRWPAVEIWLRGDSAFSNDALMSWCEQTEGVEYVLGMARNSRLQGMVADEMAEVVAEVAETDKPRRKFKELAYRTLDSWSCERRVVAKIEALPGKENPRFVVTSLDAEDHDAKEVYEQIYCARGDMENRIKEQQMGLFADRMSAHRMRANQLRLWLSGLAYVLVNALRQLGLKGTEMARAQAWTIREKLLKVGGLVKRSVRRFKVALSSAFPRQDIWQQALAGIHSRVPDVF